MMLTFLKHQIKLLNNQPQLFTFYLPRNEVKNVTNATLISYLLIKTPILYVDIALMLLANNP